MTKPVFGRIKASGTKYVLSTARGYNDANLRGRGYLGDVNCKEFVIEPL